MVKIEHSHLWTELGIVLGRSGFVSNTSRFLSVMWKPDESSWNPRKGTDFYVKWHFGTLIFKPASSSRWKTMRKCFRCSSSEWLKTRTSFRWTNMTESSAKTSWTKHCQVFGTLVRLKSIQMYTHTNQRVERVRSSSDRWVLPVYCSTLLWCPDLRRSSTQEVELSHQSNMTLGSRRAL